MPSAAANTVTSNASATHVIVGLGATGLSCARYLASRGESFAVTDSRREPPELTNVYALDPNVRVSTGRFDVALLDGATQVITSPGVSLREPFLIEASRRGIPIVGDIELFARAAEAPVAAITGTNGKSTVTTLVALMAAATGRKTLAGGNLGRPALDLLSEPTPDLYVLELSSFQLETTQSLRCVTATVLNVTSDHMDRYADLREYAAAKARIFAGCQVAVVNLDDEYVRAMHPAAQRILSFSLDESAGADYFARREGNDWILLCGQERIVAMSELKLSGAHNAANALAALALCKGLGLPQAPCVQALKEFPGLPHRSRWVADVREVRYIDDSKGTNVGATLAAVAGMDGPLVLIAGGQGKGQDFAPLANAFRGKVRHVILIGKDAKLIEAVLSGVCETSHAQDMDGAVRLAAKVAQSGDTVLLSPACASLDMFRDYAHRGDVFAAAVQELAP
jgi:UDP-N-acetylmuramoylalanine--D-glutamate ligase